VNLSNGLDQKTGSSWRNGFHGIEASLDLRESRCTRSRKCTNDRVVAISGVLLISDRGDSLTLRVWWDPEAGETVLFVFTLCSQTRHGSMQMRVSAGVVVRREWPFHTIRTRPLCNVRNFASHV